MRTLYGEDSAVHGDRCRRISCLALKLVLVASHKKPQPTQHNTVHIYAPPRPPPAEPGAAAEYNSMGRSLRIVAILPPCPQ